MGVLPLVDQEHGQSGNGQHHAQQLADPDGLSEQLPAEELEGVGAHPLDPGPAQAVPDKVEAGVLTVERAGLLLIVFIISKARTFDGENACFYFIWYGLGRTWIEAVRTDTLKLFGWELFGQPIRVSQLLSVLLAIAGLTVLIVNKRRHPHGQENLYVNRLASLKAADEEARRLDRIMDAQEDENHV